MIGHRTRFREYGVHLHGQVQPRRKSRHFFYARALIKRKIMRNCWFSHDVTKFQTSELLILLRFYFHGASEQLKTNIQTDFHSEWVLGLVID